jgi:hypothetical protein
MYDNSEHVDVELVIVHCDKFFSPPLQFILPENIGSLLLDGGAFLTRESCFV